MLNDAVGVLGLISGLVSLYISYVSFVNPLVTFNRYLRNPAKWEKFLSTKPYLTIYRYKDHPNFQIVIDWNNPVVEGFQEDWMNDGFFPDKLNNASYWVEIQVNGMLLDKELFVSLDGHRNFIPVPRRIVVNGEMEYSYNYRQLAFMRVVGELSYSKNIIEFIREQKLPVYMEDDV